MKLHSNNSGKNQDGVNNYWGDNNQQEDEEWARRVCGDLPPTAATPPASPTYSQTINIEENQEDTQEDEQEEIQEDEQEEIQEDEQEEIQEDVHDYEEMVEDKSKLYKVIFSCLWVVLVIFAIQIYSAISSLGDNTREVEEFIKEYNGVAWNNVDLANMSVEPESTKTPSPVPPLPTVTPKAIDAQTGNFTARLIERNYKKNPAKEIMFSIENTHSQYPNIKGRLIIPSLLNEYITQDDNTFYIVHDAYSLHNKKGAVFIDENCNIEKPPENLIMRGMGGEVAHVLYPLWRFYDNGISFAQKNTHLKLTTLYEEEIYVLYAIVVLDPIDNSEDYIYYTSHSNFSTDEKMMSFVNKAKENSTYLFNTEVLPRDRLLTLSTISSSERNQSIILFYRMVREGEI